MGNDTKALIRWCMVVGLAIICYHLMACTPQVRVPVISAYVEPPKFGTTVCGENNVPVIVVAEYLPESPTRALVKFHEHIHANDMLATKGGCRAFFKRFRYEKKFRVASELHAYCSSVNYAVNLGFEKDSVLTAVSRIMKTYYDTTVACPNGR